MKDAINNTGSSMASTLGATPGPDVDDAFLDSTNFGQTAGNLFEGVLSKIGVPFTARGAGNENFDFPEGIGEAASHFGLANFADDPGDAKLSLNDDSIASINKKVQNYVLATANERVQRKMLDLETEISTNEASRHIPQSKGGDVKGKGLIPTILTPGEIVITPEGLKKIGERNAEELNLTGDPAFAQGLSSKNTVTVPGTGDTDTVPADLPPGSFVINKGSSQRAGFARGGLVRRSLNRGGRIGLVEGGDPMAAMAKSTPKAAAKAAPDYSSALAAIQQAAETAPLLGADTIVAAIEATASSEEGGGDDTGGSAVADGISELQSSMSESTGEANALLQTLNDTMGGLLSVELGVKVATVGGQGEIVSYLAEMVAIQKTTHDATVDNNPIDLPAIDTGIQNLLTATRDGLGGIQTSIEAMSAAEEPAEDAEAAEASPEIAAIAEGVTLIETHTSTLPDLVTAIEAIQETMAKKAEDKAAKKDANSQAKEQKQVNKKGDKNKVAKDVTAAKLDDVVSVLSEIKEETVGIQTAITEGFAALEAATGAMAESKAAEDTDTNKDDKKAEKEEPPALEEETPKSTPGADALDEAQQDLADSTSGAADGLKDVGDQSGKAAKDQKNLGKETKKGKMDFSAMSGAIQPAMSAVAGLGLTLGTLDLTSLDGIVNAVGQFAMVLPALGGAIDGVIVALGGQEAANVGATASEGLETTANTTAAATEGVESGANSAAVIAEGAETVTNVAAAGSEGVETVANLASAASEWAKMAGGMLKAAGPILAKIAAPLVAGVIVNKLLTPVGAALADSIAGGKIEEIAPGVKGRRGVTADQAGKAEAAGGALVGGGTGMAVGAVAGAIFGPIGIAAGAAVGGLIGGIGGALIGGIKGFFTGFANQMQFNAFVELETAIKESSKDIGNFAESAGKSLNLKELAQVNQAFANVQVGFEGAVEGTVRKEMMDAASGWGSILTVTGLAHAAMVKKAVSDPTKKFSGAYNEMAFKAQETANRVNDSGESISSSMGGITGALAGLAVGMAVMGPLGAVAGALVGGFVGMNSEVSQLSTTVAGAAAGFMVFGPIGAIVGGLIGHFMSAGDSAEQLGESAEESSSQLIGALSGAAVGMAVMGPLGAVAGGLIGSFVGANMELSQFAGTLAGAALGMAVFGPLGAIVGGLAGSFLSAKDGSNKLANAARSTGKMLIGAAAGAAAGFAVLGPIGAALGGLAGAALSGSANLTALSYAAIGATTGLALFGPLGGMVGGVIGGMIGHFKTAGDAAQQFSTAKPELLSEEGRSTRLTVGEDGARFSTKMGPAPVRPPEEMDEERGRPAGGGMGAVTAALLTPFAALGAGVKLAGKLIKDSFVTNIKAAGRVLKFQAEVSKKFISANVAAATNMVKFAAQVNPFVAALQRASASLLGFGGVADDSGMETIQASEALKKLEAEVIKQPTLYSDLSARSKQLAADHRSSGGWLEYFGDTAKVGASKLASIVDAAGGLAGVDIGAERKVEGVTGIAEKVTMQARTEQTRVTGSGVATSLAMITEDFIKSSEEAMGKFSEQMTHSLGNVDPGILDEISNISFDNSLMSAPMRLEMASNGIDEMNKKLQEAEGALGDSGGEISKFMKNMATTRAQAAMKEMADTMDMTDDKSKAMIGAMNDLSTEFGGQWCKRSDDDRFHEQHGRGSEWINRRREKEDC